MKLIAILSGGVITVGMTCLVGYASAANSSPGVLISDSMLVAQSTPAPGGRGGGALGETGRADKGTPNADMYQGTPGDTIPGKARPGTEKDKKDTGTRGNTGSNRERTGTSFGSPGSGSGPSSGAGSGAK